MLSPTHFRDAGNVPNAGDETSMVPDFPSGLMEMYAAVRRDHPEASVAYYTMFGKEVAMVVDPQSVADVLDDNTEHYLWGGMAPASKAFFGPKVLFVLEGEEWSELRRVMRPPLGAHGSLDSFSGAICDAVQQCSDKILQHYAREKRLLNVLEMARLFHLSAAAKTMLNHDLDSLALLGRYSAWEVDAGVRGRDSSTGAWTSSFDFMLSELARRVFDPDPAISEDYTSLDARKDNQQWKAAHDAVHNQILSLIRQRLALRKRGQPAPKDMLTLLLDSYETECGGAATTAENFDKALGANVIELLFAGYNTVTNTIACAIFSLFDKKNARALASVRSELKRVLGGRTATFNDLAKLPLTCGVFFETLRMYPPAPAIARKITSEVVCGSVVLPKDAEVMMPICALHADAAYWTDPETFRPDRFLSKKPKEGTFVPFSGGRRSCLGQHYARLVFVALISRLLQDFEFEIQSEFSFELIFNGFGYGAGGKREGDESASSCVPMLVRLAPHPLSLL